MVQTEIAAKVTERINHDFGTDIKIEKVAISVFGSVKLKGILISDHHKDTLFYVNRLQSNILSFKELKNSRLFFGEAKIDGLNFKLKKYKGEKKANIDLFVEAFDDGKPGSGKFRLRVNDLYLTNSRFRLIDENLKNPKPVEFTNLNGEFEDFFIKGPNITANINKLALKEKRGLIVENLAADFTYTKKNIILKKMDLKTDESTFIGDVVMKYKPKDFSDFNNKVVFDVKMEKASVSSNELNFFYNEFGKNQRFYLNTHLTGTLNDFVLNDLRLLDRNKTEIIGKVNFKNLFNKKSEFYMNGNFDRVSANYDNLKGILPRVLGKKLPPVLKKLGNIDLIGDVKLTKRTIDADILVLSALGKVESKLSMTNIDNINNASYKGYVSLNNFDLGPLTGRKDIERATLDLNVDGKGFDQKHLNTSVKGNIHQFRYNGYTYQNVTLDGTMKMPYFKGYFNSNDPNLRMDFKGLIDLSSKVKNYDFQANIDYADLHLLNFRKNDSIAIFKGQLSFKAKGNTVDDIEGLLEVANASYQNRKDTYYFEDFHVQSTFDEQRVRTITINSPDIINGKVIGNFKVNQVPKIVENALGSLYANYSPYKLKPGQFLDFDFIINNKIIEVFDPNITLAENTVLKGKINADEGNFKMNFSSPNVVAYKNSFDNIRINIDNKNPLYNAFIELDSIKTKNYKVSDFSLINVTMNDTMFVRSEFKGGDKNQDFYNLNLYHTIDQDNKSVVGFKKSEVNFKNYLWFLNENNTNDNKVVFNKKLTDFSIEKIALTHNGQKMELSGMLEGKDHKDIQLTFDNVDLAKVTPALTNLSFNGNLNGHVNVKQDKDVYQPISSITVDSLKINNYDLGNLDLQVTGDNSFRKFNVNSSIKNNDVENFYLRGNVEIVSGQSMLSLDTGFSRFNIGAFGPLLGSIFSDVRGFASGQAAIVGTVNNPEIDGRLYLNEAGMKVPYLGVDFNMEPNAVVDVTEHEFLFRHIELTDTKYNTSGILDGSVRHNKLADWSVDLDIKSENMLVLDTKDSEDAPYYGVAFIDGKASIKGPTNALVLKVDAKSNKGTSIKIPLNDSQGSGSYSFIVFITEQEKRNKEKGITAVENKSKGFEMDFNLDINQNAEIEIILDRATGHAMKGRGEGSINMEINTAGKFVMNGDYQVYDGTYNYKYGGLVDKKFQVKKFSTIRWYGDPLNAVLDLEAVYKTEANPAVILDNASFNKKVPTEVVISVNGNLSNPEPDFRIEFPTVSSVLKSEIDYKLSDKDIRQTQAIALLSGGGFLSPENATSSVTGTLFEKASTVVNDLMTGDDDKFKVGLNYVQSDKDPMLQTQSKVGVTMSTQINERITINGKLGVPVGGTEESAIVGNVELQMLLNKDGSLKARVFNRENDINYIGEGVGYTQGIGLSYQIDFNNMGELWRKVFSKKDKVDKNQNPADQIPDSDLTPEFIQWIESKKNKKAAEPEKESQKVPEIE
ncbi:translocation/assembly module TamB domain-containing protein [Flavobacterium sp.]|uniref:translocation/assembly module TamB domain-containing protein n=1 Tax=Flavobacterium sp. TaxID=239 RepID=UPI002D80F750|nr:translocation/assembly module TamB domain-containing protein [Flavobacterium sp.]